MKISVLILILVSLLVMSSAQASDYYVSTAGSDAWPGTLAQPWRNISKAASSMNPGDTVYIRGGTYFERLMPADNGSEGSPITYTNYPGEAVLVEGNRTTLTKNSGSGMIHISSDKYITISGINVSNSSDAGIAMFRSNNITIDSINITNTTSSAIWASRTENFTIQNVTASYACNSTSGTVQEAFSIQTNTSHFLIQDNILHDIYAAPVGGEGIDVKESLGNGIIRRNTIYNHGNKVGIYIDAYSVDYQQNITVANNTVRDTTGDAYGVSAEASGHLDNVIFSGNTALNVRECFVLPVYASLPGFVISNISIIDFNGSGCIDNQLRISNYNGEIRDIKIQNVSFNGLTPELYFGSIAGQPTASYNISTKWIANDSIWQYWAMTTGGRLNFSERNASISEGQYILISQQTVPASGSYTVSVAVVGILVGGAALIYRKVRKA